MRMVSIRAELRDNRMNDGYVDARPVLGWHDGNGGGKEKGTLYRLIRRPWRRMLGPVSISNGLDWSPDTATSITRTSLCRIDQFDFDLASGSIKNRRPFVEFPQEIGYPDGLVVDADGFVWVALWEGGSLHRYAPDGRLDLIVPVPASQTTKCAFGGKDLQDLYITSAWVGLDAAARAEQPHAGRRFRVRPGVRGKPINRYPG